MLTRTPRRLFGKCGPSGRRRLSGIPAKGSVQESGYVFSKLGAVTESLRSFPSFLAKAARRHLATSRKGTCPASRPRLQPIRRHTLGLPGVTPSACQMSHPRLTRRHTPGFGLQGVTPLASACQTSHPRLQLTRRHSPRPRLPQRRLPRRLPRRSQLPWPLRPRAAPRYSSPGSP